ncbi:oligosaccharide flippase family protein [Ichthyenterobacterium sp. W332]|uniref:Oligosaccharide flippase family protein n=1 Tax=Microcosmobacter mediterraneus TaxID=3075607 RepID=A0ABU2YGU0_9FLAO|nr:oligosaccharide flippase family protein [Ichthyenterobacterium sp. W332]MDT0557393.1 oligosaccharide flippase family protein [Ichthyenterobacterium sp. W332]
MGIVINQSFKNTISTYLGFGLGAINVLFLYTNFLSDTYYGLVAFILSTANILMPLMAFGVHNTIIKFYSSYKTKQSISSFLTLMLFLPLLLVIPLGLITLCFYETIAELLSHKNTIIHDYVWHIFIAALAMAYFEIFYAWSKTQLQSVFGNLMKEVFHRIGIMLLLFAVYFKWLTVNEFIYGVIGVYVLRMLIMKLYAFSIRFPSFTIKRIDNIKSVIAYASLIIVAGSIATMILDIDKFMIGEMLQIEEVAYYSVAVFIGTVIAVPQRAMHQIMSPLTAQFLNNNLHDELKDLYQRSSLTLLVISGFIFLLVVLNINQLYLIIPQQFSEGLIVVFLISLAKLYDNMLGNNNAILFNSNYYRMVLVFGVLLAFLAVVLNFILIPIYGIEGSALATFLAVFIYNTTKVIYVKHKFKISPFTKQSYLMVVLITLLIIVFYFWDFQFHPILNIALKSLLLGIAYIVLLLRLDISEDISTLLKKYIKF